MINLNQILNRELWNSLKKNFVITIVFDYSVTREEAIEARETIAKRIQKYKHRDVEFRLNYPNCRMYSYVDRNTKYPATKPSYKIVFKLKLNLSKEIHL